MLTGNTPGVKHAPGEGGIAGVTGMVRMVTLVVTLTF